MNATLEAMMANFNSYKASKTAKTTKKAPRTNVNRADLVSRIMTIETRIGEMA